MILSLFHDNPVSDQIIKELYPDQETFKKEEQRRFQLILEQISVFLDQELHTDIELAKRFFLLYLPDFLI